jgi:hypothetical protein
MFLVQKVENSITVLAAQTAIFIVELGSICECYMNSLAWEDK